MIRCIRCGIWIHPNDMLNHGINIHNSIMAKHVQLELDRLNALGKELGIPEKTITDILPEDELQARLFAEYRAKEKLR